MQSTCWSVAPPALDADALAPTTTPNHLTTDVRLQGIRQLRERLLLRIKAPTEITNGIMCTLRFGLMSRLASSSARASFVARSSFACACVFA